MASLNASSSAKSTILAALQRYGMTGLEKLDLKTTAGGISAPFSGAEGSSVP
jgi:hypothetical protein